MAKNAAAAATVDDAEFHALGAQHLNDSVAPRG